MSAITRREAIKKGGRLLLGAAAGSLLAGFGTGCSSREVDPRMVSRLIQNTQNADIDAIRLTALYDNVPYGEGLRTDWGFSCLVEGLGVRYVAPSHCSGTEAREIFARVYGDRFIDCGVGRTIIGRDLV